MSAGAESEGTPVVLVHGFLSTARMLAPMRRRLMRAGHRVFPTALDPLCVGDVRRLARQLDATVRRVREETGAARVSVVGVSQGGLIALWWARHLDGWAGLERLVLVGAPVQGTWAATIGLPVLGPISRGIWQMLPTSPLVAELAGPLPGDVPVVTIALRGDPMSPPARCHVPAGDNRVCDAPLGPLRHQWLVFSRTVSRQVLDALDGPVPTGVGTGYAGRA